MGTKKKLSKVEGILAKAAMIGEVNTVADNARVKCKVTSVGDYSVLDIEGSSTEIYYNLNKIGLKDNVIVRSSGIESLDNLFASLSIKNLDVSEIDTSNVTRMVDTFYYFSGRITGLEKWDTSNVKDMHEMFMGVRTACLDLTNFNFKEIQNMKSMFERSHIGELKLNLTSDDITSTVNICKLFRESVVDKLDFSKINLKDNEMLAEPESIVVRCKVDQLILNNDMKSIENKFRFVSKADKIIFV